MFIATKYETLSPNDTKSVHGLFESIKAFEDNSLGIRKHNYFNEYYDHKYTYILKDFSVNKEIPENILSVSLSTGTVKYLLDSKEVTFYELKQMKYRLKFDNFRTLLKEVNEKVNNKVLDVNVGKTLEQNIRKIYTFSF